MINQKQPMMFTVYAIRVINDCYITIILMNNKLL